jgi:hypothetical protein
MEKLLRNVFFHWRVRLVADINPDQTRAFFCRIFFHPYGGLAAYRRVRPIRQGSDKVAG